MKKIILFINLLAFTFGTSFAQKSEIGAFVGTSFYIGDLSHSTIFSECGIAGGVVYRYNFTPRWAVGLGVRYTNLSRTFLGIYHSGEGYDVGDYDSPTSIDNQQHWMGIPLTVYYDIVNRGRWRVHAFTGGSFENMSIFALNDWE